MRESAALAGFNAVLGALASPRRLLDRICIERGRGGPRMRDVIDRARRAGIPVSEVGRERLDQLVPGGRHQGVVGIAAAQAYGSLESMVESCDPAGRLVLLDGVEDPRNLGAVVRTAAAVGVKGVVVPEHRSAGLSPGAARAAAGALAAVEVARCRNVADLAIELKDMGFWVAGLDQGGDFAWDQVRYPARMALIVGGESKGLRPRVKGVCDATIALPLAGEVESLNLSVAAAVVLYEALRQDRAGRKG